MFSHIIIFGSSLPEALGGQLLYANICERVLIKGPTLTRSAHMKWRSAEYNFMQGNQR
jgi:hypothetical protein